MELPEDHAYSLDELADKSGFDKRVIRSFIEQGLLRGPENMGRYARYSPWHLTRLLAIKELKERRGLQLGEIRRCLITMSTEQIAGLARSSGVVDPGVKDSALDYIRSLKKEAPPPDLTPASNMPLRSGPSPASNPVREFTMFPHDLKVNPPAPANAAPPPLPIHQALASGVKPQQPQYDSDSTAFDQLLQELAQLTKTVKVRRQSKAESWFRIEVTPDIQLSIRGIENQDQLSRLERIADHLRELLLRGNHA